MSAIAFFLTVILMVGVVISLFHRTAVFLPLLGFVTTFFAGYLGSALLGTAMNWPDAGAIVATATMGAFILWALRHPKPPQKDGEDPWERWPAAERSVYAYLAQRRLRRGQDHHGL